MTTRSTAKRSGLPFPGVSPGAYREHRQGRACLLRTGAVDVVLLDQQLPDAEGYTICPSILKYNEEIKIVFATAYPSFDNAIKALKGGATTISPSPSSLMIWV